MIEVDQLAGEICVFKCSHHQATGRLIDHRGNPDGGAGELAERGELIPAILRDFKIAIQDKIHTLRTKIKWSQQEAGNQKTAVFIFLLLRQ